ncbi:MAG: hypothetical protein ACXWMQ_00635 [Gemmatimonadaceae bacterium]
MRSDQNSKQLTSSQREAIRKIRVALGNHTTKPEKLLVAFKGSLNEIANDARLPLGGERSAVMDRFVSAFIEELYKPQRTARTSADDESNGSGPVAFTPAETHGLSDAHP